MKGKILYFIVSYVLLAGLMTFLSFKISKWFIIIFLIASGIIGGILLLVWYLSKDKKDVAEEKAVKSDVKLTPEDAFKICLKELKKTYVDDVDYIFEQYPSRIGESGKEKTPIYTIKFRSFWKKLEYYFFCNMNDKNWWALIENTNSLPPEKIEPYIELKRNRIANFPQYVDITEVLERKDAFGNPIKSLRKTSERKDINEQKKLEQKKEEAEEL